MPLLDSGDFGEIRRHFSNANFRNPSLLGTGQAGLRRVLGIGSCFLSNFIQAFPCPVECLLFHGGQCPAPALSIEEYDAVLIQIPLRTIIRDHDFWHLPIEAEDQFVALFDEAVAALRGFVAQAMVHHPGGVVPTFVMNFLVPAHNPNGLFFPHGRYANARYFIEQLNRELESVCASLPETFVVDVDAIANTYGKRHFSDEWVAWYAHGAAITPGFAADESAPRIEHTPDFQAHFPQINPLLFYGAIINEMIAKFAILKGHGRIKMVFVDLDDTLWRGVVGEDVDAAALAPGEWGHRVEGWPLGVVEALMYCKKRGVLLGVLSKNDETVIRKAFPALFGERLELADFAVRFINWNDKPENMREALSQVNLLPEHVLFIDDNPVERARMAAAFPQMRIVGKHFLYLRSLLLNAPELQVPVLTPESAQRGQMVEGQRARVQAQRASMGQEFLRSLALEVRAFEILPANFTRKIGRVVELINKTNQWNSTGEAVSPPSLLAVLQAGERIFGFMVRDRYAAYGDVGFVRVRGDEVVQMVMSCRVAGLGVEHWMLKTVFEALAVDRVRMRVADTGRNGPFLAFSGGAGERAMERAALPDLGYVNQPGGTQSL